MILIVSCSGGKDDDDVADDDAMDDDSTDDDDSTTPEIWVDIAAGRSNTCGIHEDGSLECFGYTDTGIVDAPEGEFVAVSCGINHCIALDADGEAVSWGCYNEEKEWCQNPEGPFVQVDAGAGVSCGLRPDGSAECWGNEGMEASDPVGEVATKIDAHGDLAVGLREDGTLLEWGPDYDGPNEYFPGNYKDISIGQQATCVIKLDDSFMCHGYVGMGWTDEDGSYRAISTNDNQICAITTDGEMVCRREYEDGIPMPSGTFQKVLASYDYSCAHSDEGWMECWGGDEYKQSTFGSTHLYGGEVDPPPDSGAVCEETEPNDVNIEERPPWEEANDCQEMTSGIGQADSLHGVIETMGEQWDEGDIDGYYFVTSEEGYLVGSLEWGSAYTDLDWMLYCYYGDNINPWEFWLVVDSAVTAGYKRPAQAYSIVPLQAGTECYVWIAGCSEDDMTEYTMWIWTEPV